MIQPQKVGHKRFRSTLYKFRRRVAARSKSFRAVASHPSGENNEHCSRFVCVPRWYDTVRAIDLRGSAFESCRWRGAPADEPWAIGARRFRPAEHAADRCRVHGAHVRFAVLSLRTFSWRVGRPAPKPRARIPHGRWVDRERMFHAVSRRGRLGHGSQEAPRLLACAVYAGVPGAVGTLQGRRRRHSVVAEIEGLCGWHGSESRGRS
jgi:hypothetical protein